jgi:hypothetical protein
VNQPTSQVDGPALDRDVLMAILVDSYNSGSNIEAVAKDMGISNVYAHRLIKASDDLPAGDVGRRISSSERRERVKRWELAEAVRRHMRGEAITDIAEALGRDPQTVRTRLRSAGLVIPPARNRQLDSQPVDRVGDLFAFLRNKRFTAIPIRVRIKHDGRVIHAQIEAAALCEYKNGRKAIQLSGTGLS